jgi:hypothetical protein
MTKTFVLLLACAGFAGAAHAQDAMTSYGPLRFGVTTNAAGTFGNPFRTNAGQPDNRNPIYQSPLVDRAHAADASAGPSLGLEGGGSPMSRGGINDTLTGYRSNPFGPVPSATPPAKAARQAGKARTADAKTADTKTADPKAIGTKPAGSAKP